jgi:hypothetical protein
MKKLLFLIYAIISCTAHAAAPQERTIENVSQELLEVRLRLIELRLQPQTKDVRKDLQKFESQEAVLEKKLRTYHYQ